MDKNPCFGLKKMDKNPCFGSPWSKYRVLALLGLNTVFFGPPWTKYRVLALPGPNTSISGILDQIPVFRVFWTKYGYSGYSGPNTHILDQIPIFRVFWTKYPYSGPNTRGDPWMGTRADAYTGPVAVTLYLVQWSWRVHRARHWSSVYRQHGTEQWHHAANGSLGLESL